MDSKTDLSSSLKFSETFKISEKIVISVLVVVVVLAILLYAAAKKIIGGGRRNHGTGVGGMVQGGIQLGGSINHVTGIGSMGQGEIELGAGGIVHGNDGEIDLEAQAEVDGAVMEG